MKLGFDPLLPLLAGAAAGLVGYLLTVWGIALAAGFPWARRLPYLVHPAARRGTADHLLLRVDAQTAGMLWIVTGVVFLVAGVLSEFLLFYGLISSLR